MKALGLFLGKILGVVLIILFAFWVGSLIWMNLVPPECEVVDTPADIAPRGNIALGEEAACSYADGFDSEGRTVPSGTQVVGPALVKPKRDLDHVLLVMPEAEYITSETDEVIWLLVGDTTCVKAQAEFFSTSEIID